MIYSKFILIDIFLIFELSYTLFILFEIINIYLIYYLINSNKLKITS